MLQLILASVASLIILGLPPILFLCFKMCGASWGTAFRRTTGVILLVLGPIVLLGMIFAMFDSPKEPGEHHVSVVQLGVPIAMVFLGWHWLTKDGPGTK